MPSSTQTTDIQSDLMRADQWHLLRLLLQDKTSKKNILWGSDTYAALGPAYAHDSQITPELITGKHCYLIRSRAQKRQDQQSARTKTHAEVFTPMWVCAKMNDTIDDEWFGFSHAFFDEQGNRTDRVVFPEGVKNRTWRDYVTSKRLEITCGEAPYLVSRYDVATGEPVDIGRRIGMLDRKLRVVGENTADEGEWMRWALRALQSTFGYEFQGDNLLIARLNVLATFEEYLDRRWHREATIAELRKVANIIAWNIWQMDGLTYRIPFDDSSNDAVDLFEAMGVDDAWGRPKPAERTSRCRVYNWSSNRSQPLVSTEGKATMKFDYIIGNPPYQEETEDDSKSYAKPIYDCFLEAAYQLGRVVEMIHPARFLFNAGSTPKAWNEKMLNDEHLKVLWYEADGKRVFANTDIKGGVAITYRNEAEDYGAIGTFTAFPELNSIIKKVNTRKDNNLSNIMTNRGVCRYSTLAYSERREELKNTADPRIAPSAFERMPTLFTEAKPQDGHEYIQILGNLNNERVYRWFRKDYLKDIPNLYSFRVIVPKAIGNGTFGETIASPLIIPPLVGFTETFIAIGESNNVQEAESILKYIKTKFVRALLGALKVTQNGPKQVWRLIPLQDFTSSSDIDWSQSVSDIDKQLYKKYNLSDDEIDFIKKNVKEMK